MDLKGRHLEKMMGEKIRKKKAVRRRSVCLDILWSIRQR